MDISLIIELFGYLASIIVAVSIMLKSFIRLRKINMIGSFLLVIYSIIIKAYPVAVLNLFICIVNFYFILQYYKQKEYFRIIPFQKNSAFLREFLIFYKDDIKRYFPEFEHHYNEELYFYYILRNMIPACVFVIRKDSDNSAEVLLDYVVPEYRDAKIGNFIFNQSSVFFKNLGINKFIFKNPNLKHLFYLMSVGFESAEKEKNTYIKVLSKSW
ncbi:MAG: hypothetical protein PHY08_11710 [Candidatus Cloacimonetes bacterium]|nr:hypothetical protein [Candidatus Cloacimonadota bacterium]MDD4157227.1 hypothetical protein [Candidatus Cloacimonadota bacterium]